MALIAGFKEGTLTRVTLHDQIDATVIRHEFDGRKLLQINTHGRQTREIPDKVSQTLQLDEKSARQLYDIMQQHFGFR